MDGALAKYKVAAIKKLTVDEWPSHPRKCPPDPEKLTLYSGQYAIGGIGGGLPPPPPPGHPPRPAGPAPRGPRRVSLF